MMSTSKDNDSPIGVRYFANQLRVDPPRSCDGLPPRSKPRDKFNSRSRDNSATRSRGSSAPRSRSTSAPRSRGNSASRSGERTPIPSPRNTSFERSDKDGRNFHYGYNRPYQPNQTFSDSSGFNRGAQRQWNLGSSACPAPSGYSYGPGRHFLPPPPPQLMSLMSPKFTDFSAPIPRTPIFGDTVLEKGECLVNHLEQKRKLVTEDKIRRNKTLHQIQNEYVRSYNRPGHGESYDRSDDVNSRSQFHSKTDISKALPISSFARSSYTRSVPTKETTVPFAKPGSLAAAPRATAATSSSWPLDSARDSRSMSAGVVSSSTGLSERDFSPTRTPNRPAPKLDTAKVNFVKHNSEPLSRASIAKLINAPRTQKDRQRLASIVKKSKTRTLRPKLNVQTMCEVGDLSSTCEVSDMLDLVDLPDSLRLKVENLLENGPDVPVQCANSNPNPILIKSPSPKRAKHDHYIKFEEVEDVSVKQEPDFSGDYVRSNNSSNCDAILSSTLNDSSDLCLSKVLKSEPNWDVESIASVTTASEEEVRSPVRKPFERLAGTITADPTLNALLEIRSPKCATDVNTLLQQSTSEKQRTCDDHLAQSSKSALNPFIFNEPHQHDTGKLQTCNSNVYVSPSAIVANNSPSASTAKTNSEFKTPAKIQSDRSRSLASGDGVSRETTRRLVAAGDEPVQNFNLDCFSRSNPEVDTPLARSNADGSATSLKGGSHPIVLASNAIVTARAHLQNVCDSLLFLHNSIQNPVHTEDTVNLVLDITEKEEHLSNELKTLATHCEELEKLIFDATFELERLNKLRMETKDDGEILRRRRLEILREAVSKQNRQNYVVHSEVSSSCVTDDVQMSEEERVAEIDGSETTSTIGEDVVADDSRRGSDESLSMQYVGSVSLEEFRNGNWLRDLNVSTDVDKPSYVLMSDQSREPRSLHTGISSIGDKIIDDKVAEASKKARKQSAGPKKPRTGKKQSKKDRSRRSSGSDDAPDNFRPKSSEKAGGETDMTLTQTRLSHAAKDDLLQLKSIALEAANESVSESASEDLVNLATFKNQLLETPITSDMKSRLLESIANGQPLGTDTALFVSQAALDQEISMKLMECSVVLQKMRANKNKTSKEDESVVDNKQSNPKRDPSLKNKVRRRAGRGSQKSKKKQIESDSISIASTSESECDRSITSNRSQQSFASDSRKRKLRKMGIILSPTELEEYCKDGHNLSESSGVVTPRTYDQLSTARTEDLLAPPRPVDLLVTPRTEDLGETPRLPSGNTSNIDDSDSYSSCYESVENFDSRVRIYASAMDPGSIKPVGMYKSEQSGNEAALTRQINEKHELEQSREVVDTPRSDVTFVSQITERHQDPKERTRVPSDTCIDSGSEVDAWVVKLEQTADVEIVGETKAPSVTAFSPRETMLNPACTTRQKFQGHTSAVTSIAVCKNYLFTCSPSDGLVRKFNLETCQCDHVFTGHDKVYAMLALDFKNRSFLFTGGYDCILVKYDLQTNECLSSDMLPTKIRCLATSWDIVYIGLSSGEVYALHLETGAMKRVINSSRSVSCLDTALEGSRHLLVVGSFDPLVSVHDAKNGLLLRAIRSHARVPLNVKVHLNLIYSIGADKSIKLHNLNSGDLIRSVDLASPVTDLVVHGANVFVSCFDGLVRWFNKDLALTRMIYGAGRKFVLRILVHDSRLYSTSKNGEVESILLTDTAYACQIPRCSFQCTLISDLEYHVTEKHIDSRIEANNTVFYCSWLGCCFETRKRMELENHLLNHIENLAALEISAY